MTEPKWYEPYISCWRDEEPSQFAKALAVTLPIKPGATRLLDIGCGSGIIGIYSIVTKQARSVTFMDKEQVWLNVTRCNVDIKIREGLIQPTQVGFLEPSDFAGISYDEVAKHDLVAFNPPQLPYAFLDETARLAIDSNNIERSFRRGGDKGLEIAQNFFLWYAKLPSPKPDAVVMFSSFLGESNIEETIASAGLRLRQEPIAISATLRRFLWEAAEKFSLSPTETADRRIRKTGETWYKDLLTYRIASD